MNELKKFLTILFICSIFSCVSTFPSVYFERQDSAGGFKVWLMLDHTADEADPASPTSAKFKSHNFYERYVHPDGDWDPAFIRFEIKAEKESPNLTGNALVRVDGIEYAVNIEGMNSSVTTSIMSYAPDEKGDMRLIPGAYFWKSHSGGIYFTKILEEKLKSCTHFSWRVYAGKQPITFRLSNRDLRLLKELISVVKYKHQRGGLFNIEIYGR